MIIGVGIGGLLVAAAVNAWRSGQLPVGQAIYRRGESRFGLAVGGMAALGGLLLVMAVVLAADPGENAGQAEMVVGYAFLLPAGWHESEGVSPPDASDDVGMRAYGPEGELVVTWR
ncbi:MAG: hypothetical protein KC731_07605, partial [Myxococcales bacterium]|nr:hypothetical protein [Myxococcales bacterium]